MLNPIDSIINPSFVERGTFSISPDKSFKYPQNGLEFSNEFFINVDKISLENVLGPLSRTFEATAHEEIVVSQCCLRFTDQVFHRKKNEHLYFFNFLIRYEVQTCTGKTP